MTTEPQSRPPAPNLGPAPRLPIWRYIGRLTPLALLWVVLVGWLGWLLYSRAEWTQETDEADVREWLNETRVFRKSLPELVSEYVDIVQNPAGLDADRLRIKHEEIEAHLGALAEPMRKYTSRLPLFPELYYLGVEYPNVAPPAGRASHPAWKSPVPRPGADAKARVRVLEYAPGSREALIRCEYRIHTNHQFEQAQQKRRSWQIPFGAFLVICFGIAGFVVYRFLRRERRRELARWAAAVAAEHRERELLETRVRQQEAERETEELGRKLLEQELEAAKLKGRASEAERAALELKSQLYASVGIMAGSYAHNIKNLLVRPNDLLARCMETEGVSREQHAMLQEVKITLGTVTERLQQILKTIRRDPSRAEMTQIDLSELVRETQRTWADMAREKWKVRLTSEPSNSPLPVKGDLSHLQQAVENLVFNARDATFEMRNHLREEARRAPGVDAAGRKQKLIEAAAWKGEVGIRTRREGNFAVLEVRDNGIGMTEQVRENCLKTHFTTKRDNALYEGYSAGMGLGLSFVAVVLEHHQATLEIESSPLHGALFRVRIPLADGGIQKNESPDRRAVTVVGGS